MGLLMLSQNSMSIGFIVCEHTKSADVPRTIPASGPAPRHSLQQSSHHPAAVDCGKENTPAVARANQSEPARFQTVGKIVYLGNGTWIPKAAFDRLMKQQKDSVFVRKACMELFSFEGLVGRSVTGAISNRTKAEPKPALDAEKFAALDAFFKHYLQGRFSPGEVAKRHRGLRKIVAMKIADVMKMQKK